ncbi:MAG: DNA-directed RNA polymerase subunit alpha, partial [Patescibacteria group bacterium]|nr:DNA-directed RNA polymerase subunit alpha [Patescibacteria group bacterium]
VEATRVGRMTNLDKLIMEIWTDGTLSPFDAMKSAAKILIAYFSQIIDPKETKTEESNQKQSPSLSEEVLKMKIEEFDVPTRIVNSLARGGIETIGQLLGASKEDLMNVKNLGMKSLQIVAEKLKEKGIMLSI